VIAAPVSKRAHRAAGDEVLHQAERAALVRDHSGDVYCVSPVGNRYPISPALPCTMSVCGAWLGLTLGQLETFLEERRA
jgi:hypothetical protein